MFYPTTEYAYIDENGQTVEPSRFTQHVYPDSSEPAASHLILDENSPDNNQQQIQYRPIVIDGSQPLAKCSVLYLGTAISSPGQRGIDAIQEPLSRRYPVDGKEVVRGIEAWLSIYDNGLQLQFARDPSVVLFYPIRSLVYCASIRFATRTQTGAEFPNGWRFVPLDSPAAARVENTRNPPLFAVTFRRTRHLPVDECHSFVTKTRQAALALVQACFSAYQATTSQQDCSKVPLYFKVDDYGSKNQEIDNEIRIVPAPDRERTLDYQTNKEGAGFYYKTDRVPIDTWQLWEHHKHDVDRSTKKSYHSTSRSLSCSSSHSRGSSSLASCSSSSSSSSAQQTAQSSVDPYAPAPNLIRVERIKDVNTGQDVFIRWVSDATATTGTHDDQQISVPQQVYSTQPPNSSTINYDYQIDRDVPNEIERLTLHDEHLRRSLLTNDRSASTFSNHEQKKHKKRSKQERYRGMDNQEVDYEVVSGFFEDRNGKRRPVKLDRSRINTVKDYRHLYNDAVNSSSPNTDRRRKHRAKSLARSPIDEQQQQQFITPNFPLTNQPFMRPFGTSYLPFNTPFFPKQPFSTAPLFSRPNFINRLPLPHPSLWYRPM
ncbi:unnamed protein product [Rotaria socialis]